MSVDLQKTILNSIKYKFNYQLFMAAMLKSYDLFIHLYNSLMKPTRIVQSDNLSISNQNFLLFQTNPDIIQRIRISNESPPSVSVHEVGIKSVIINREFQLPKNHM